MEKSQRTAIGGLLQTCHKHNLPYTFLPNSVINQYLGIAPDKFPQVVPWTQYAMFGDGALGTDLVKNKVTLVPLPHMPQHTGLYSPIPVILRELDNDLTVEERKSVRLRRVGDFGLGRNMIGYYAYVLDMTGTSPGLEYRRIIDGNIDSEPWVPSPDEMNPKPQALPPGKKWATSGDYIAATAKSKLVLNAKAMTNFQEVSRLLYDNEMALTVSEIALCSGVDDPTVTGLFEGQQRNYIEAVGVQITDFVASLVNPYIHNTGTTVNMDTGSVEPLLAMVDDNG